VSREARVLTETTADSRPAPPAAAAASAAWPVSQQATNPVRRHGPGYSRFVAMMKFLLPTVAVLLVTLVGVWPYLQVQDNRFRIGFSALKAKFSKDASMVNPRYVGTGKDTQPFTITADLAKNLLKGSAAVELEMPEADITLKDGTWLVLTAKTGVYSRDVNKLALVGAVNLFHDSGYEFRTSKADIDLAKGTAVSNTPVRGHGPFGTLKAEGFRVSDKGKTIYFTGKSKLVIFPDAAKRGRR